MSDQAPQTLDELLDSDELYEKDGYGGYQVDKDYAKAALTALIEREVIGVSLPDGVDKTCAKLLTAEQRKRLANLTTAQRKEDKKGEN